MGCRVVETRLKLLLLLPVHVQLIYAGKVLKDPTLMVKDIVQQVRPSAGASGVCAHWLKTLGTAEQHPPHIRGVITHTPCDRLPWALLFPL